MYRPRPLTLLSWLHCIAACFCLGTAIAAPAQHDDLTDVDQAEVVGWSDPGRANQLLDEAQAKGALGERLEEIWAVRGQIAVDNRKDEATRNALAQLQQLGARSPSARLDARVLQIYLLCQQDQYDKAAVELKSLEIGRASCRERV